MAKKKEKKPFIPKKYIYIWKWLKEPKEPDYYLLNTTSGTEHECEEKMIAWAGCRQVWKWMASGEGKVVRLVIVESE